MAENDSLLIYLRDCTVPLFVGVYDHEKPKPQPVSIEIEVTMPLTRRYDELGASDLSLIIDYDQMLNFVTVTLPMLGHIPFLETIAERIIDFCFQDARIAHVKVHLRKPEIWQDRASVGIEMQRRRI